MEGFCRQRADYHIFLWGMESAYMADYLIGADQKIPNWLVKATFLREVVTVNRLGIKPWAGGMGLAQETPFAAYCLVFLFCFCFFFNEIYEYYYCLLILCFMPRHQVNGKSLNSCSRNALLIQHFQFII